GNFAMQLHLNFYGTSGYEIRPDSNFIYDTTNIEKFNIPLYTVSRSSSTGGHGMDAILVGENPLNWDDWSFVEPQNDSINVQSGTWNIPLNSKIEIKQTYWYYDKNKKGNVWFRTPFLTFNKRK
ncbi:MAG: hypothetical protein QME25_06280, partial [Bacteroidota bacterium]|nr:hypothetical protein [Bacteroidota bacterium]